jgi:hypothetical protein
MAAFIHGYRFGFQRVFCSRACRKNWKPTFKSVSDEAIARGECLACRARVVGLRVDRRGFRAPAAKIDSAALLVFRAALREWLGKCPLRDDRAA